MNQPHIYAVALPVFCRSGQYVYKPTMNRTCCPQYPIRCEVANQHLTKSQKKVIKQVNRYLSHGECRAMAPAEPERHAREEASAAAAGGWTMMRDDAKPHGPVSSSLHAGSTSAMTAAGASELQSPEIVSPAGCDKKAVHKTPKPGVCFFFREYVHDLRSSLLLSINFK